MIATAVTDNRIALQKLTASLGLTLAGATLIALMPDVLTAYAAGYALLFAGIAYLIDLSGRPDEPAHPLAVAIIAGVGILVGIG